MTQIKNTANIPQEKKGETQSRKLPQKAESSSDTDLMNRICHQNPAMIPKEVNIRKTVARKRKILMMRVVRQQKT